jgi:predicted Zn-dependent peptidase
MFKKTTLKNGLRIITVPQKNTQSLTVLVLVGTGSKYEKKEINGISHFLEHMYFKGTKKRPSTQIIAETLDKVGGIYNAFTGEEYTGYFAKVAAPHFELALDWVSDIFLNSILPKEEIEKEKGVIIEEINMIYDHPMSYVQTLWTKLLYGNQPAGWDIAGKKETVSKMTREKLSDYMERQYVAKNTIISIAGNFDEKLAIQKVKKYFSKIKTKKPIEKPKVIDASIRSASTLSGVERVERQEKPEVLLNSRQTDQTHLCLGTRSFNLFHPQRYALDLLTVILGGMMSSRLFIEVRSKLGIAYYINTNSEMNPDTGFLFTQTGLDNKNVEKGILTILKEYKKISEKKVPTSELKKAKDYLKGKTTLLLESSDAQASFYAAQEVLEKKILTPEEIFKKIDQVSREDILKVAKEIFRPEKLNLALIGPFKNQKPFEKLLKI